MLWLCYLAGRLHGEGIYFFGAVLLKQDAKELKSGNRNDQENTANHANHKRPAQDMSHHRDQGIKHIRAPEPSAAIL